MARCRFTTGKHLNAAVAATGREIRKPNLEIRNKFEIRIAKSETDFRPCSKWRCGLALQSFHYGFHFSVPVRLGAAIAALYEKGVLSSNGCCHTDPGAKRHEPFCRTIHVFHCIRPGLP